MKKLTATLVKSLAKDLGLTLKGTFKNGYSVFISNPNYLSGCNSLYETFKFNVKELGDENTYYFLKGLNELLTNDMDELAKHWATFRLLDAKKYAEWVVSSPENAKEFAAEWDDLELESWEQNEEETAFEICPNVDVLHNAYHYYDSKEEYVLELGKLDDAFWTKYILED